jgi:hypothetical protein
VLFTTLVFSGAVLLTNEPLIDTFALTEPLPPKPANWWPWFAICPVVKVVPPTVPVAVIAWFVAVAAWFVAVADWLVAVAAWLVAVTATLVAVVFPIVPLTPCDANAVVNATEPPEPTVPDTTRNALLSCVVDFVQPVGADV